jgi:hypothetical protein
MSTKNLRRRAAAVVALMLVVFGASVAVAAWTQTGTGSGSAKAVTAVSSTIATSAATADLYPGKSGGSVYFTVDNPNPYPVNYTSLAVGTVTSSDPTNCPATSTNITVTTPVTVSIAVPASASATAKTVAGVTNMPSTAVNGCQGVTFTVALTLTGTSA